MEHSKETIESIKEFVRKKEMNFQKTGKLLPITQTACAEHIGVHTSTVCRIIKSGIKIKLGPEEYPIEFFFSQRKIHPEVFAEWINRMVRAEDPSNPISDNALLSAFNEEFPEFKLKLRTIIKYRSAAGIESKNARRRTILKWMLEIIKNEDPRNPLTDQMLVERFKQKYPALNINEKQVEKLRKRAGIKDSAKRQR